MAIFKNRSTAVCYYEDVLVVSLPFLLKLLLMNLYNAITQALKFVFKYSKLFRFQGHGSYWDN